MTETQEIAASPFATFWFSPRQTIERIVSRRPTHMVLPLAMIGTIAMFYMELADHGLTGALGDWRRWLALVLGGAGCGVAGLYLSGLTLSWSTGVFGGRASALQLRAVVAWSMLPIVLGSLALLAVVLAPQPSGTSAVAIRGLRWLITLWSVAVFMLMLGRVGQLGFWRTILAWFFNLILTAIFAGLLVALPVRILLYQPFNVPARSMMPTLLRGDYFFASKFAYGYNGFSLPFSSGPLLSSRIFGSEPQRGDVVVFRPPKDTMVDYVKRIVGLPGDRIQIKDGLLYINDVPVQRQPLSNYVGGDPCGTEASTSTKRWRETLPNGVSYETLDCVDNGFYDNTTVYNVPAGHYFMLGDNRDNSTDSRVLSSVGYIPLENLVGRVGLIFYSSVPADEGSAAQNRAARIGTTVR